MRVRVVMVMVMVMVMLARFGVHEVVPFVVRFGRVFTLLVRIPAMVVPEELRQRTEQQN
jgi:hypothetical protein